MRRSINTPGHAHELTFSCHQRLPLLRADRTRQWFIDALDRARSRWSFDLWAFVIMPEHVHLLLRPRDEVYDMAVILKAIKQPVARLAIRWLRDHDAPWLERLTVTRPNGRVEHRFWQQGGGYDRNIDSADTAVASIDYLHANPVRRGLAGDPIDWPWSSARSYAGLGGEVIHIAPPEF